MINLEEAIQELSQKSYGQVQEETAWKWASRAAASYQNCLTAGNDTKLICWTLGEEYYHEAVEHAALDSNNPGLLQQVRDAVHHFQEKAAQSMESSVGSRDGA